MNSPHPPQAAGDRMLRERYEQLTHDFSQLKRDYEELSRHKEELLKERNELSQRLNAALSNLATRDAGSYSSAGSGPQHDHLVQTFRQLKIQRFQELTQTLFDQRRQTAKPRKNPSRNDAVANIRALLANEILLIGSRLLAVRRGSPGEDMHAARQEVLERLRRCLEKDWECHLPDGVLRELDEAVARGLKLVRDMAAAAPPGSLLFPKKDAPFEPDKHEPLHGRPAQGEAHISLTVFPGYLVGPQEQIFEKALVYLTQAT